MILKLNLYFIKVYFKKKDANGIFENEKICSKPNIFSLITIVREGYKFNCYFHGKQNSQFTCPSVVYRYIYS